MNLGCKIMTKFGDLHPVLFVVIYHQLFILSNPPPCAHASLMCEASQSSAYRFIVKAYTCLIVH